MAEQDWRGVDEGWGRRAVDFAALAEPSNCREYVAMHQLLGVGQGDRLLDIACGAGLALELASARGATCHGLDASPRLVEVARDRSPEADIRVGDMHALPWGEGAFDVVTTFRGIWGTTPNALDETFRVLVPGGRLGITVWGHLKASPGVWALSPFTLAEAPKVANQAAMVALGRPGVGEELLAARGFIDVARHDIPFAFEFADPETYARALAATGPAYEAIQTVGEEAFRAYAEEQARARLREGLPLRAVLQVVGYVARTPVSRASRPAAGTGFLAVAPTSDAAEAMFEEDREEHDGHVMNGSRLWAHDVAAHEELFDLIGRAARGAGLSFRQRGVLVTATASALGDAYCALAWGQRLAGEADAGLAAGILRGSGGHLDPVDAALAGWARALVADPNATSPDDVQALRDVGFDDGQIFHLTLFVALRLAFSSVNDALGARPDGWLADGVPEAVRAAVTYGRPVDPHSA